MSNSMNYPSNYNFSFQPGKGDCWFVFDLSGKTIKRDLSQREAQLLAVVKNSKESSQ